MWSSTLCCPSSPFWKCPLSSAQHVLCAKNGTLSHRNPWYVTRSLTVTNYKSAISCGAYLLKGITASPKTQRKRGGRNCGNNCVIQYLIPSGPTSNCSSLMMTAMVFLFTQNDSSVYIVYAVEGLPGDPVVSDPQWALGITKGIMRHTDGIIYYCEFVLEKLESPNIMLGVCNYDADPYRGISPTPPPFVTIHAQQRTRTHYNPLLHSIYRLGLGGFLYDDGP